MKKNYTLTACILFAFSLNIYAQAPDTTWTKALGGTGPEQGTFIKQTTDGGYVVTGNALSNDGDVSGNNGYFDFWVVKINSSGVFQWQKCLGNTGLQEATSIDQTADGGFIVAGHTSSGDAGEVTGTHGDEDFWIVKLSADGQTIEGKTALGGTYGDYAASIEQTTDGGYIVAGQTTSNNGDVSGNHGFSNSDAWIVKLKPDLTIEWQKCKGGTNAEGANAVKQTFDGGYIVAGYTMSNDGDVNGYHGGVGDYWVVRLNSVGDTLWTKTLGGSAEERANSVYQTADGDYVVAGYTKSNDGDVNGGNNGGTDYWVVKLDGTDHHIVWQFSFGGISEDVATSIVQTTDDGFIVAGYASSNDGDVNGGNIGDADYWIIKLSNAGAIEWRKNLGGTARDEAYCVEQTFDGGYVITGRAVSNDRDVSGLHGTSFDFWVVKLSPDAGTTLATTTTNPPVTKTILGNHAIEVTDGNDKLIRLTPTRGANALSGNVETTVTIDNSVQVNPNNNLPYVQRHYDITPIPVVNPNNSEATVTLYFTQTEFDNFNAYVTSNGLSIPLLPTGGVDNGNVRITQEHGEFQVSPEPQNYTGPASFITPDVLWDNLNNYWIITFPVTGFSGFFLSTVNVTTLPLTLIEFKGWLQKNAVALQWLTNDEVNTKEFVIEHSNQNISFAAIGKVAAQSTFGTHQYSFTDADPLAGDNFYRLKMTDKDGHFTYSNIVLIKLNETVLKVSAYPNPAKNILNVKISSTGNNIITMLVTDLSGKVLLNNVTNISNGENIIPINISQLAAGSYILKLLSADGKENGVRKFIKQ